jgi:hypothetical protein
MYLKDDESFSSQAFGSPVVFLQSADGIIKITKSADIGTVDGGEDPSRVIVAIKCMNCNRSFVGAKGFCSTCGAEYDTCEVCSQLNEVSKPFCWKCGHRRGEASAAGPVPVEPGQRAGVAQYAESAQRVPDELAARHSRQPAGDASDTFSPGTNGQ